MAKKLTSSEHGKGIGALIRRIFFGRIADYESYLGSNQIDYGVNVTRDAALKFTAVFAAVKILSENIASLPRLVTKVTSEADEPAPEHPAARLLAKPNRYSDPFSFWFALLATTLTRGNGYVKIDFSPTTGLPEALHLLDPTCVSILLDGGNKTYVYRSPDPDQKWLEGTYLDSEVLHFMFFTLDGIIGVDPITYNAASIGRGIATGKFSADFYRFVYRDYGAIVYQRELWRFNQRDCDSCFFTADGDMLFAYAGQFADEEDCRGFIADNDVVFSVAFGPVLIDDGEDVFPERYRYGEIWDTYARAAIGMLGERHYLTMNVNKSDAHYVLVTLRQAADAMVAHGCVKAYTLDGGQTAETVFNGAVVNPLQKPWEKPLSDAICFVSAYPGES